MDYSLVIAIVILAAGIGGFIVLARTLLHNWKAQSRGKEEIDAYMTEKNREFEKCIDDCMSVHLDPDTGVICDSICRSRMESHAGA